MNDNPQKSRESLWRRKLTDADREELRAHPEVLPELELESNLSEALRKLPDVAVASNFTARVMQAIEREETQPLRSWSWNWHKLIPRLAVTTAVVLLAGTTFHHYELASQRTALAKKVALMAGSQPMPSVEALNNFDAIRRMSQPVHADEELLALMQ